MIPYSMSCANEPLNKDNRKIDGSVFSAKMYEDSTVVIEGFPVIGNCLQYYSSVPLSNTVTVKIEIVEK